MSLKLLIYHVQLSATADGSGLPIKYLIYRVQPPATAGGSDTMKYLELKNIKAAYDANPVLRDFSLSIERGEFVALLGASGCGKTTALKIVAGLLEQDAGEIWLDGNDISRVPAERREISLVFQKPLLFPFLTVAENVAFGLKMRNFPKADVRDKVAEVLKLVQLENFGGCPDSFPADRNSASRSPARLLPIREFCYWTNRFPRSTRVCGRKCEISSANYSGV